MHKYGLKLWSSNRNYANYAEAALRLFERGVYSYIELFVVPGSYDTHAGLWAELEVPYVIHAPHYDKGVNLARKENLEANLLLAAEALRFADRLKADTIIFHPGIDGDVKETARQLNRIDDSRIVIENKPYYGRDNEICVGSLPEDLRFILDTTRVGFCLDLGHAICAANAVQAEPMALLRDFMTLGPKMFHLTDGEHDGMHDRHDHFGSGDYAIVEILKLLPEDAVITVETDKDSSENLDDFAKDIAYLKTAAGELRAREAKP